MEAVAAVGLAASVLQFVTFGLQTVRRCNELRQTGSLSEYTSLENQTTGHIENITKLQVKVKGSSAQLQIPKELLDISDKCTKCANNLAAELQKLKVTPGASRRIILGKVIKALNWKTKIDLIKEELESLRRLLQEGLLVRLFIDWGIEKSNTRTSFVDIASGLSTLNHKLSEMEAGQKQAQGEIEKAMKDSATAQALHIESEHDRTRQHVTQVVADHARNAEDDIERKRVLEVLAFEEMHWREDSPLLDAFENTFDFIFQDPPELEKFEQVDDFSFRPRKPRSWHKFPEWLVSDDKLYWIKGKPGSGKSTLMKYVRCDPRTYSILQRAHPDRQLYILSSFFWLAGSPLQRSLVGMLRSLVYQLLQACPQLTQYCEIRETHHLTESRLCAALIALLKRAAENGASFCIFLDGLDEYEGRFDQIAKFAIELSHLLFVRICVSSRQELDFSREFDGAPSLVLQDLTYSSIVQYARAQLQDLVCSCLSEDDHRSRAEYLIFEIPGRAEGVFLWAFIVIRDLRDGLHERATIEELESRVFDAPSEVSDLFFKMLQRIKPYHRQEACRLFQLLLVSEDFDGGLDIDLLHLATTQLISSGDAENDLPYDWACCSLEHVPEDRLENSGLRLRHRTAGMVNFDLPHWSTYRKRVTFIHRTARDFLVCTAEGSSFLAANRTSGVAARLALARGMMLKAKEIFTPGSTSSHRGFSDSAQYQYLAKAFALISKVDRVTSRAQTNLVDSFDYCKVRFRIRDRFMIKNDTMWLHGRTGGLDVLGLAVSVGMFNYVCTKLDIQLASLHGHNNAATPWNRKGTGRACCMRIDWSLLGETESIFDQLSSMHRNYRHVLAIAAGNMRHESESRLLMESYLLCKCHFNSSAALEMVRILLDAGADPNTTIVNQSGCETKSSWERWLVLIRSDPRRNNVSALKEIVSTTEAFVKAGADLNSCLAGELDLCGSDQGSLECYRLVYHAPASFVIQDAFGATPFARDLCAGLSNNVQRTLAGIKWGEVFDGDLFAYRVDTDENVSDIWLKICMWEQTGSDTDLNTCRKAVESYIQQRLDDIVLRECAVHNELPQQCSCLKFKSSDLDHRIHHKKVYRLELPGVPCGFQDNHTRHSEVFVSQREQIEHAQGAVWEEYASRFRVQYEMYTAQADEEANSEDEEGLAHHELASDIEISKDAGRNPSREVGLQPGKTTDQVETAAKREGLSSMADPPRPQRPEVEHRQRDVEGQRNEPIGRSSTL